MRWRSPVVNEARATALAQALGLRPLTARILEGRGLGEPDLADRFLNPRLSGLRGPEGLPDLDLALARLSRALEQGERIGVFGDYDVDGVTSAAVLAEGLRALGAEVEARVARRDAGYGFSPSVAREFADAGCKLVVTGDCGTSDHEAVRLLAHEQVDTIIIDHHQVPEGPTPALALINPHRADSRFPFKGLASCGLAFYLVAALRTRARGQGRPGSETWDVRATLDLVALGTVADVVPLVQENRILVAAGLRELARGRRPGLRALARLAEVDLEAGVDAAAIGFRLAPRLNAAGRLGDAGRALSLLLAADASEAERRAGELESVNRERQLVQEGVVAQAFAEAERLLDGDPALPALVVAGQGWHPGVVGIVAAKLVDRFARPAIVIGLEGERGRGSARTVPGFDLYRLLSACADQLVAFGGHAMAAGLTVEARALAAFRAAFVSAVAAAPAPGPRTVTADAVAELRELDVDGVSELQRLGPFGCDNGEPLLALPGVTAAGHRLIGNGQHLLLTLEQGAASGDAIAFGSARAPAAGSAIDVLGVAELNLFRGRRSPRVRLRSWAPASMSAQCGPIGGEA